MDSAISSDTMSSVSLCENDIPGSSLDGRNQCSNIVSPKMPRSGVPAIFMNSVYVNPQLKPKY